MYYLTEFINFLKVYAIARRDVLFIKVLESIFSFSSWIEKFFLSIYGSPSTKLDNLRTIFSGYNISPDQTVFFGDALADFIAARDAGCDFIGIGKDIKNVLPEIKRNSERNYGLLNNFEPLL